MTKERVKINKYLLKFELSKAGTTTYNQILSILEIDRNRLNYCFKNGFEQFEINCICNYLDIREEDIV